ncbi:MAG TPA: helix-turn-helix transcriptional regulator [Allosphingosinicella sp.]|jgi:transcriptional regulator with XRE-family HTH domain
MSFGARLKEERRRLGLKQAELAALVGTDMAKQSLYERGERQLRADYLARLESTGVDLLYVLTGRRIEVALLDDESAAFISTWLSLPDGPREALRHLVAGLSENLDKVRRGEPGD